MLEIMSGDTGECLSAGSVASRIKLLKANFEQGQKDSNNQGRISPSPGSPKLKRIDNCMGKNGVLKPVAANLATEATSKLEHVLGTGDNNTETNARPSPKPSPRFARKDEGLSHPNRPRFDTAPESEMDARLASPPSQSLSSKLSKSVSDSILHKDVPVMIKDKSDNPRPSPRTRPPLPKKAIAEEETDKISGGTREVIEQQNQTEEVKKPALQQKPSRPPMPVKPGSLPSKAQPRPPLPKKMTLLDRPQKNEHAMSVVIQSSQGSKQESDRELNLSWKHRNGPPKRPVPPGPGTKDFNSNVVPAAKEKNKAVSTRRAPPVPLPKKDYPVSGDEREMSDSEGRRDVFAPPSPIANRRPVPSPKSKEPQRKGTKPPPVPASKRPNRSMAEEQSLYSYAYDPDMALPALSGPRPLKPELDSDSDESNYESPDSAVVQGMMNSISNKTQNNQNIGRYEDVQPYIKKGPGAVTTGEAYVVPDENTVKGFMQSIQNKSDMKGSSSDVEEYDLPDENVIPPPPVKKPENLIMKKVTQMSSYSDDSSTDEDDPTYIDPNSVPSRSISSEGRRTSHGVLTPDVYLPAEMQEDSDYVDPENLPTVPSHLAAVRTKSDLQTLIAHDDDDSDDDDEPLYQVYAANVFENQRNMSVKSTSDDDQAIDSYGTGTLQRILWSELNSVRRSGILDTMSPEERKRQEAMFEVITSEGSYLKSMHVLCSHFLAAPEFGLNPHIPTEEIVLDKQQIHFLFTGVKSVTSISEQFLAELRQRQEENVLVTSISDVIEKYATSYFDCYVKYCSNQIFQDRTLNALVNNNQRFCEVLSRLESSPKAKGLSMQSFMMLPMQRITRMPLLVDAICHRCEAGSDEFQRTDRALRAVNKVVRDCNEGARRMERTEEMYFLQCMLTFKTKPIPLISSSRWLLRRGEVMCVREESKGPKGVKKSPLIKRLKGKSKEIYLFLFTDLLLVTKMKSGENFKVIDHCSRSMLRVEDIPPQASDTLKPGSPELQPKHVFSLILLENSKGKTVDYVCMVETGTDKLRWLDAFTPSRQGEAEGEKIYEEWDCPQVQAIHTYQATQPDEITLQEGDVVKVLRKLTDGWYEGLRLRDGEQGWFPANHTEEILSEHVRARNLLQRYRLLNASAMIMGNQLKK